ncbi:MAG: efflux RND transporter permease subunit [Alphaproteobacteria bacterium]|nr:efflux RND transporter permease subunit [Alphaproteobacteria bacterium]
MLASLVRFSVRFRGVIVALSCLLLVYGGYRLSQTSLDIFPEFSPKLVIIQTESPGLSSEQVEVQVSRRIENALSGQVGLDSIRSQSIQGLSVVTLIFDDDSDLFLDRQLVAERLANVATQLPEGIGPPIMVPLTSSSSTIMTIGVTSETVSLMDLRTLVDWTVTPRLLSVAGVADVNVFGGEVRQFQIQIMPDALRRHGLSIEDVVAAAEDATGVLGAGFIENKNQRIVLRTEGQPKTAAQLADVVVRHHQGVTLRLGDVAKVVVAPEPRIGGASIGQKQGVLMMVIGQYGANTMAVTRNVEVALEEFSDRFREQGITLHGDLFRPANYIQASLGNITGHLMVGAVLVISVLFLFLFNMRSAFISATAIPLSLISAAVVLVEMGASINIMVLGGLAIALGEVVDDAIIDTENIFRRLRENRRLEAPKSFVQVVFDASMEVRGSVVYASFIVMLVFVPLLTMSGVAGRMFEPLGIAYILAIMASLIVALTVTPALCCMMLGGVEKTDDPPVVRFLKPLYGRALAKISGHPRFAIIGVLLFCGGGIAMLPLLGGSFLPELREGHYMIHTASVPGTSIEESLRVGGDIMRRVSRIEGVRSVSQWAGRAERGADTLGTHYSEYEIDLVPLSGPEQQRVKDSIRDILDDTPGMASELNTFLIERVDETISGYTAPVVVNIFGNDLDLLDRKAQEVARVMATVPGATDIQLRAPPGTPLLKVRVRLDDLKHYGIRPMQVFRAVQTAYEGRKVGQVYDGARTFSVVVIMDESLRRQPPSVEKLPLSTPDGRIISLQDVADIIPSGGRYVILHSGAQRLQTVTCNVDGRDLASFFDELKARIGEDMSLPADTYLEFTGAAVAQAKSLEELLVHSMLAGVGILVLLYVALASVRNMLLVLVNLPFSLVGGVAAALLTGGVLSIGSLVGFVTLFGITLRNSIMMVSHFQHLVDAENMTWNRETAIRGAQERLPSILITALVTALAMLPIAVNSDNPGREIMGPMAAIVIGGLISSTILNLLVLPAIMLRYGRFVKQEP